MIDIYDKLDAINKRIEAIQIQVDFLENEIESNLIWDEPEKPSREYILSQYVLRLDALNRLKNALTQ